jgi:hypothetical protein
MKNINTKNARISIAKAVVKSLNSDIDRLK